MGFALLKRGRDQNNGGKPSRKVQIMSKDKTGKASKANDSKKGGKGIPRVTSAVVSLDEAGRKAWLESLKVTDEVRKVVEGNLEKALKKGVKGSKFNAEAVMAALAKQPITTLVEIQKGIAPLIAAGKDAARKQIEAEVAERQVKLAALEALDAVEA